MFDQFEYKTIPLGSILLDVRNPRLVTLKPLGSESEIVDYMFAHERLPELIEKIVSEGRNIGAERPYVIKSGSVYTVIEGNRRIATYKLLAGIIKPSKQYIAKIPAIDDSLKSLLLNIECTVAPSRDDLLPIMANAHFGLGDKSKWGYLGSRKAVHDEYVSGRSVASLAFAFDRRKGQIRDYILEYKLYLESLALSWTGEEREALEDPSVEFNPPVRFLQTQGHKDRIGIEFNRDDLLIVFSNKDAKAKLKHLVEKLVVKPQKGLGATASFDAVFDDFKNSVENKNPDPKDASQSKEEGETPPDKKTSPILKPGALFNYPVSIHSNLIKKLAHEAKSINCNNFPAAGTFLLRNLIEAILKHIIDEKNANPDGASLSLEKAINLATTNKLGLSQADKQILSEFRKSHLNYINLGAHGNVIPNPLRLFSARDCIDLFVKRYI